MDNQQARGATEIEKICFLIVVKSRKVCVAKITQNCWFYMKFQM